MSPDILFYVRNRGSIANLVEDNVRWQFFKFFFCTRVKILHKCKMKIVLFCNTCPEVNTCPYVPTHMQQEYKIRLVVLLHVCRYTCILYVNTCTIFGHLYEPCKRTTPQQFCCWTRVKACTRVPMSYFCCMCVHTYVYCTRIYVHCFYTSPTARKNFWKIVIWHSIFCYQTSLDC